MVLHGTKNEERYKGHGNKNRHYNKTQNAHSTSSVGSSRAQLLPTPNCKRKTAGDGFRDDGDAEPGAARHPPTFAGTSQAPACACVPPGGPQSSAADQPWPGTARRCGTNSCVSTVLEWENLRHGSPEYPSLGRMFRRAPPVFPHGTHGISRSTQLDRACARLPPITSTNFQRLLPGFP